MKYVTVFYESSHGILCQWKAEVLSFDHEQLTLKFSPKKALRYPIRHSGFILITNKEIPPLNTPGMLITGTMQCFDESLRQKVRDRLQGNTALQWDGREWIATA